MMATEANISGQPIQKWCNFCGQSFHGTDGAHEPFCKECECDEA